MAGRVFDEVNRQIKNRAQQIGVEVRIFQSKS